MPATHHRQDAMLVDERVFEDDHFPRRLLHREHEVRALLRALEQTGDRRGDALVHGPSGVGKTVLVRHAFRRLSDQRGVQTARVHCLGASAATVMREVLTELPGPDPAQNTPRHDLCLMLRDRVDGPLVVALDEADGLARSDVLSQLFDVPELSVVVICHDPDAWLAAADTKVRRRLSGSDIGLDRYGMTELADILDERARVGLADGAVDRNVLEAIADRVAGVARNGIQTLREAARIADQRGHERLPVGVLEDAREQAQRRIRTHNLQSLTLHHQLLYEILRVEGALQAGELHDRYDEIAAEALADRPLTPVAKRTRRRHLDKLVDYDLVKAVGENRNREYRVCDEGVKPTVGLFVE